MGITNDDCLVETGKKVFELWGESEYLWVILGGRIWREMEVEGGGDESVGGGEGRV